MRWVVTYAAFELLFVAAALGASLWRWYRRRHPHPVALPPGFERTQERFIDPTTGIVQEVWYCPRTGERRYQAPAPVDPPGPHRRRQRQARP